MMRLQPTLATIAVLALLSSGVLAGVSANTADENDQRTTEPTREGSVGDTDRPAIGDSRPDGRPDARLARCDPTARPEGRPMDRTSQVRCDRPDPAETPDRCERIAHALSSDARSLQALEDRSAVLRHHLARLHQSVAEQRESYRALSDELAGTWLELAQTHESLVGTTREGVQLHNQLQRLRASSDRTSVALQSVNHQIAALERTLAAGGLSSDEAARLRSQLLDAHAEHARLRSRAAHEQSELTRLADAIRTNEQEQRRLSDALHQLRQEANALQGRLDSLGRAMGALHAQAVQVTFELDRVHAAAGAHQRQMHHLRAMASSGCDGPDRPPADGDRPLRGDLVRPDERTDVRLG